MWKILIEFKKIEFKKIEFLIVGNVCKHTTNTLVLIYYLYLIYYPIANFKLFSKFKV